MSFHYNHMIYSGWLICIWCWGHCDTAPLEVFYSLDHRDPGGCWGHWSSQESYTPLSCYKTGRGDENLLQQLRLGVVKVKKCGTACLQLASSEEISSLCYGKGYEIRFGGCKNDRWRAGCQLSSKLWNMRIEQICGLPACKIHLEGSVSSSGLVCGPSKS